MKEIIIILLTFHTVSSYRTLSELFQSEQVANHLPKSTESRTTRLIDESLIIREVVQAIIYIFVTLALSIIGCCFRKCYQNDGRCKWSWFMLKTPAEYNRRRAIIETRHHMIMESIQQRQDEEENAAINTV